MSAHRAWLATAALGAVILIGLIVSLAGIEPLLARDDSSSGWLAARELGGPAISVAWCGLIAGAAWWMSERAGASRVKLRAISWRAPVALCAVVAVELALKLAFTGTSHSLEASKLGWEVGFYPSGHAARATLLVCLSAGVWAAAARPAAQWSWVGWVVAGVLTAWVAAALTLSGAHYLIDTVGGAALGAAGAVGALRPPQPKRGRGVLHSKSE